MGWGANYNYVYFTGSLVSSLGVLAKTLFVALIIWERQNRRDAKIRLEWREREQAYTRIYTVIFSECLFNCVNLTI